MTGDYSGPNGTGNNTSVQFISAPATYINFGLNYPIEYYQPNPLLTVPSIHNGNPLGGGSSGTSDALYGINYDDFHLPADINNPMPTVLLQNMLIGTTWGATFDKNKQYLYVSAALKRHAGFGPLGPGGIYRIDMTNPLSPVVTNWFTVPNAGIDPRIANPLPNGLATPSRDSMAYLLAGKMSLGGLDLSDDGSLLYVMNLNTKSIDVINTSSATISSSIPISIAGISDIRPWGVKYYRGSLYALVVDPKEGTGGVPEAYILKNSSGSWSTLFQFSFSYTRDKVAGSGSSCLGTWNDWDSNPANFPAGGCSSGNAAHVFYPQPILSDIEFDHEGSLILGVIDRFNLMSGHLNYQPSGTSTSTFSVVTSGDILRVCNNGGTLNQENFGICTYPQAGENEWYAGETFSETTYSPTTYSHGEISMGGLAILPGTGEVVNTVMDPINGTVSSFGTGGVRYLSNTGANVGLVNKAYKLYGSSQGITKAYGLGDIEFVIDPPPIEIGNRIWLDSDQDGVQDPNENPISGVTVQLVNSTGTVIATAVTNSTGNYYFTNAAGTNTSSSIFNITQLMENKTYTVRIPNASGGSKQTALNAFRLTTQNANSGIPTTQADVRDSDGTIVGTSAEALVLTSQIPIAGANNHTFDFGFFACPPNYHEICNDGSDTLTLTADAGFTNVMWYDSTSNTLIGSGSIVKITSSTNGLSDTYEAYYYTALDASGCAVNLCCPVQVKTIPCCQISVQNTSTLCNNNGTPGNSLDDWFSLTLSATVTGGSGSYVVKIGAYTSPTTTSGNPITITGNGAGGNPLFQANGTSTYSVIVQDAVNGTCMTTFTIGPVAACSACPSPNCYGISVQKN